MKNIASPWVRFLAGTIDFKIGLTFLLLFLLRAVAAGTTGEFLTGILDLFVWAGLLLPLILVFLNCFLVSRLGGSIGKLLTGIEIVNPEGNMVTFWRAFLRNNIGYMASGLLFYAGFFWIFRDKERRGWHDQIADTYVVVKNQAGVWIGILCLVLLTLSNLFLLQGIVSNFKLNRDKGVYLPFAQMMQEFAQSLKTNKGMGKENGTNGRTRAISQQNSGFVQPRGANSRCGEIPAEVPVASKYQKVLSAWSNDCQWLAYSIMHGFAAGDSLATGKDDGLFVYDAASKKIEQVFNPKTREQAPEFIGWADASTISFCLGENCSGGLSSQMLYSYNVVTKKVLFSLPAPKTPTLAPRAPTSTPTETTY